MGNTKIKICGITRICEINWLNEIEPDYAGFVFARSRRRITLEELQVFRKFLSPRIKAVGLQTQRRILLQTFWRRDFWMLHSCTVRKPRRK